MRIRPFRNRLESEKYECGGVYTFKSMNDLACGDDVYWMEKSAKKGCEDSGIDRLDEKADFGRSSCDDKHVNQVRT